MDGVLKANALEPLKVDLGGGWGASIYIYIDIYIYIYIYVYIHVYTYACMWADKKDEYILYMHKCIGP